MLIYSTPNQKEENELQASDVAFFFSLTFTAF